MSSKTFAKDNIFQDKNEDREVTLCEVEKHKIKKLSASELNLSYDLNEQSKDSSKTSKGRCKVASKQKAATLDSRCNSRYEENFESYEEENKRGRKKKKGIFRRNLSTSLSLLRPLKKNKEKRQAKQKEQNKKDQEQPCSSKQDHNTPNSSKIKTPNSFERNKKDSKTKRVRSMFVRKKKLHHKPKSNSMKVQNCKEEKRESVQVKPDSSQRAFTKVMRSIESLKLNMLNLEQVMKDKRKSSAFLEYLTNMWKEANYLFILDVDEYKCIENEVDRRNKALDIRNKYLKMYACFEIKISNETAREVLVSIDKNEKAVKEINNSRLDIEQTEEEEVTFENLKSKKLTYEPSLFDKARVEAFNDLKHYFEQFMEIYKQYGS